MKRNKSQRSHKWVQWLSNFVDRRDDDWFVLYAKTQEEAERKAVEIYRSRYAHRFSLGNLYPIQEFRRTFGRGFPL